jgi:hypothetical protein
MLLQEEASQNKSVSHRDKKTGGITNHRQSLSGSQSNQGNSMQKVNEDPEEIVEHN